MRISTQQKLDTIIELKSKNGVIKGLKNSIFNLTNDQIDETLKTLKPISNRPHGELTDAQTLGVGFAITSGSCLLADSVGLGKTVQTAGYINYLYSQSVKQGKTFRCIFFGEKKPQQQLQRELVKFTGKPVHRAYATQNELKKFIKTYPDGVEILVVPHSIITSSTFYSYVTHITDLYGKIDLMVLDEGSVIGNHLAQRTKSFYQYSKLAQNRLVLNATPFERKLQVLYNQLYFVNPDVLDSRTTFNQKYCIFDHTTMRLELTSYKNEDLFYDEIKYLYFGNTRAALGAKITNSDVKLHTSKLTKVQRTMYRKTQYYGLVNDCPTYLDRSVAFTPENVPKLQMFQNIVENEIPKGEQILVFSHYKMSHHYLKEYIQTLGYTVEVLNGDVKSKLVDQYIQDFKDKKIQVLITNIQKSLNFGNCDHVIFYSFTSNPSNLIQMEGRVTRDFHVDNKHFHLIVMQGREYKTLIDKTAKTFKDNRSFIETDNSVISTFLLNLIGGKS